MPNKRCVNTCESFAKQQAGWRVIKHNGLGGISHFACPSDLWSLRSSLGGSATASGDRSAHLRLCLKTVPDSCGAFTAPNEQELLKYVVLLSDVYTSAEANSKPVVSTSPDPAPMQRVPNTTKVDADLGDAQSTLHYCGVSTRIALSRTCRKVGAGEHDRWRMHTSHRCISAMPVSTSCL
jgi:hypothetical protein